MNFWKTNREFRRANPVPLQNDGASAGALKGQSCLPLLLTGRVSLPLAILAVAALSACRNDMHVQPRYDPLAPTSFFADGRSERPAVPGTVARGELRTDELLYTGKINGQFANVFPFPITQKDLERGRERYNVYCTPCHDYTGSGKGTVVRRGFALPPSYHIQRLVQAPVGHFFDVMTNGYGTMYSYAERVPVKDRWRIAAYIRALQMSQAATIDDVPAAERPQLLSEKGK
ncbi:MAG TPA: cytochrome c [Terriglobia bacterium]|nr:cytochrome c [Terriglobia bacterium]